MAVPFLRETAPAPGEVEQTTALVRRVVCNNPSAFTYRGTNSYIIGRGQVAVMDPGPVDEAHRRRCWRRRPARRSPTLW